MKAFLWRDAVFDSCRHVPELATFCGESVFLYKLFSMNRDSRSGPIIKGFQIKFLLWKEQCAAQYIWDVPMELYTAAQGWGRDGGDVPSFQLL